MTKVDESQIEKFDKLYKMLLTPISIISVISFNCYLFLANMFLSNPEQFSQLFTEKFTAVNFMEAVMTIARYEFEFLLFSIGVFIFIFFAKRRLLIILRCISLFLLILALLFVPFIILTFMDFLPYFIASLLISSFLSIYVGVKMGERKRNLILSFLIANALVFLITIRIW